MKMVSKRFYLVSIVGGFGASILLAFVSMVMIICPDNTLIIMGLILLGATLGLFIYGVVIYNILLYKMWESIPSDYRRTTPGKAVGFHFIPLFNFYWILQAWWGWTKDYNKYASKHNMNVPKMPEGIALTFCILNIVSIIPTVRFLTVPVNFVLMIIFLNKAIDGINAIIKETT